MTAAELRSPAAPAAGPGLASVRAGLRLVWLHVASRRIPAALAMLAACGATLRAALAWHWLLAGSADSQQMVPVVIEAGAAMAVALATSSPIGEPERATPRWLPWLRLGCAIGLTVAASGALAAGAAGAGLPGGTLDVLRNVAGMAGLGLICAAVTGGQLAWIGPMTFLAFAEFALTEGYTTPWIWPDRPPHDQGAAMVAAAVFAAGLLVTTVRGARDQPSGS